MCFSDRKHLFELLDFCLFFNKRISKPSLKSEKETISPAQSTGLGWRRPPPEIAARWRCVPLIKKMIAVLCKLSLSFPLGSLKTPVNGSKLVLKLSLFFVKSLLF